MWFQIDPSSGTPIYLQLVEQVKQAVAGGILSAGQRLPATRDLAIELAVNPNTVIKAYQVLERDGVIELPRGKGAFVATHAETQSGTEERLSMLMPTIDRLVAEAYRLGLSETAVVSTVRKALRDAGAQRAQGGGDANGH